MNFSLAQMKSKWKMKHNDAGMNWKKLNNSFISTNQCERVRLYNIGTFAFNRNWKLWTFAYWLPLRSLGNHHTKPYFSFLFAFSYLQISNKFVYKLPARQLVVSLHRQICTNGWANETQRCWIEVICWAKQKFALRQRKTKTNANWWGSIERKIDRWWNYLKLVLLLNFMHIFQ